MIDLTKLTKLMNEHNAFFENKFSKGEGVTIEEISDRYTELNGLTGELAGEIIFANEVIAQLTAANNWLQDKLEKYEPTAHEEEAVNG